MGYIKYKGAIYVSAQREISLATVLKQLKLVQAQLKLAQSDISKSTLVHVINGAQELLGRGMQTLKLYIAEEEKVAEKLEAERLNAEAFAPDNKV